MLHSATPVVKSAWENLSLSHEISNTLDSYRNEWISLAKIHRTMVIVTTPLEQQMMAKIALLLGSLLWFETEPVYYISLI